MSVAWSRHQAISIGPPDKSFDACRLDIPQGCHSCSRTIPGCGVVSAGRSAGHIWRSNMEFINNLSGFGFIQPALWAAAAIAIVILLRVSNIFRYIPNNQVGIVEKLWTTKGSIQGGFIALHGEPGYEPQLLPPGRHPSF